ncbi:hypothetical protein [Tenacibaculum sp. 190524A02b]|uniref:hypothetical protein n=1 Tax=Tenacibaculum vairaonense TaxID=3137860 RepID=UPI0031FAFA96
MEVAFSIKKNREDLKKIEEKFKDNPSLDLAERLVNLLMSGIFGEYYNENLESFFVNYADRNKKLREDFKIFQPKKNKYLHVASQVYLHGGHTRILERWIDASNDTSEEHTVILLNQTNKGEIPDKLKEVVAFKKGSLIILDPSKNIIQKANELRDKAFEFGTIILHHHPQDPIPLMAFGVEEFKRPIICFNHSGHTFWLGRNVVDHCIDIEKNQNTCTIEKRRIENTTLINMPVDEVNKSNTKEETKNIRVELGVDKDALIISTMASMYKFMPIQGISFTDTITKILDNNSRAIFLGIGVTNTNEEWNKLINTYENRVFLLGAIPHDKISRYLIETDLYIDSFPYNSWVSLIDAISIGKLPVLVLKTPVGYPNFLEGTKSVCNSPKELVEKAFILLDSKPEREDLFKEVYQIFQNKCSKEAFYEEIKKIYSKLEYQEKKLMKPKEEITNFDAYNFLFRSSSVIKIKEKGIKNLFQIKKYKEALYIKKVFLLFGVKVFEIRKSELKELAKDYNVLL